jgi:hypothetical protein
METIYYDLEEKKGHFEFYLKCLACLMSRLIGFVISGITYFYNSTFSFSMFRLTQLIMEN